MPKDYFISDVHIETSNDEAAHLFIRFLNICEQERVDRVFLLGDIFDLMVGPYDEYEKKYRAIFDCFEKILRRETQIFYFEGNHDFHLRKLFQDFQEKRKLEKSIKYIKGDLLIQTSQDMTAHISHGDDMEIDNASYKIYKKLVNNRFVELFTEQVVSFGFVERIGQKASADSKRRNQKRYSKTTQDDYVRDKFRKSAEILSRSLDVDLIIAGHSHCKDDFKILNGPRYLNNGYAVKSQSFICIDENGPRFIPL